MRDWHDRVARRLASGSRAVVGSEPSLVASPAANARMPGTTRREHLKVLAAGAAVVGASSSGLGDLALGASCVRVDESCLDTADSAFGAAARNCADVRRSGGLYAELRCQVQANLRLLRARAACRQPSDALCARGQHCNPASGRCVSGPAPGRSSSGPPPAPPPPPGPCDLDQPTLESLEAARIAVAGGATDVAMSPRGCMRYQRTVVDGRVTSEVVTLAGKPVIRFTHGATDSTGEGDGDLDGFNEWRARLKRGTDPEAEVVVEDYWPATRTLRRRETRTLRADTVHVVREEDDGSGRLLRSTWDTPNREPMGGRAGRGARAAGPCTAAEEASFNSLVKDCVDDAMNCLTKHKANGTAASLGLQYVKGVYFGFTFTCDDTIPEVAYASDSLLGPFTGGADIVVNRTQLATFNRQAQKGIMCHELMHYGAFIPNLHHPAEVDSSRVTELDDIYACQILCFGAPNKCHCATCLGTHVCDPRCAPYPTCNPDLGGRCNCICRLKWYPTYTQCTVECPSGLCCFASGCTKISRDCPPP